MTTKAKLFAVTPAAWVPGPVQGQWTYKEYKAIPEDGNRYEVVDGVLYMTPSPSVGHQKVAKRLVNMLCAYVEGSGFGEVFMAPLDVELGYGHIVQPDVFVLLNEHLNQILDSRIVGAPDLIIEIASPGTAGHDRREKQDAYASSGVPEYWIVTPDAHVIEVLTLEQGAYHSQSLFGDDDILTSHIIPGLSLTVSPIFA